MHAPGKEYLVKLMNYVLNSGTMKSGTEELCCLATFQRMSPAKSQIVFSTLPQNGIAKATENAQYGMVIAGKSVIVILGNSS